MDPISHRSAERIRAYAFNDLQTGRIGPRQYNQLMAEMSRAEYHPRERQLVGQMMNDLRNAPRVLRRTDRDHFYRSLGSLRTDDAANRRIRNFALGALAVGALVEALR